MFTITPEQARLIWREVMTRAHKLSKQRGYSNIAPGTPSEVGLEIWSANFKTECNFETWWNTVHNLATKRKSTVAVKKDKMSTEHQVNSIIAPDSYYGRYTALVMEENIVPLDGIVARWFGCSLNTLSGIRTKLRDNYNAKFELVEGGWRVVQKPNFDTKPEPKPEAKFKPTAPDFQLATIEVPKNLVLPNEIVETKTINVHLERIEELLEKLLECWTD
jgi:hypothetical protein